VAVAADESCQWCTAVPSTAVAQSLALAEQYKQDRQQPFEEYFAALSVAKIGFQKSWV